MNSNIILRATQVEKSYVIEGSPLHALRKINIDIEKDKITAIIGKSGAGKSTLLYILSGLLRPTNGSVYINERSFYGISDSDRSKIINECIGFVFQDYQLLSDFTVLENVFIPAFLRFGSRSKQYCIDKATSLLKKMDLLDRKNHLPVQLSGGEQQRVAILRSFINEPEIIFCDEPTGNLDEENSKRLIDLILEFNNNNSQTFVLVSHDEKIKHISDKVFKLSAGALSE